MGSHPNRRPHGFGNRWVQAPDRVAPETDLGAHRAACLEQVAFQTLISRERVLPKKKKVRADALGNVARPSVCDCNAAANWNERLGTRDLLNDESCICTIMPEIDTHGKAGSHPPPQKKSRDIEAGTPPPTRK